MRKPLRLLTLLASLLPTLVLAAPTPMRLVESYASTDVINVGANTIGALSTAGGGQGTLVVSGLSGTVSKAWLYWKGIEFVSPQTGFVGGNGIYDEPEIRFDGQLLNGSLVATQGSTDCHPAQAPNIPASGAFYRADVTSFIQARGNGNYAFSGLSDGLESIANDSDAHSANGLSLVIYFDDGNSANDRRVDHYEGQLSNTDSDWGFAFPLDYIGGSVEVILHVSDGQTIFPADGQTSFTTRPGRTPGEDTVLRYSANLFADGLLKYAGLSVPMVGNGRTQGLWDIRRVPITAQFSRSGRYATRMSQELGTDCVSLQLAQVVSAPASEATMLSPGTHNFGDVIRATQSAAQRFTVANLWPYPIQIPNAPQLSHSDWYRVLTQTCSGQTLAPGASCTFDLACMPPPDTVAGSLPAAYVSLGWQQGNDIAGTLSAKLRCGGVPNAPFSRMEFTQPVCTFPDLQVNSAYTGPALVARNTGALPVTILSGIVTGTGSPTFSLLSTSCSTGRVLAPNDSCEVRALIRTSSTLTSRLGSARVNYTASDTNSGQGLMVLEARTVAATTDGETLFKNGFDLTAVQCLE